MDTKTFDFTIIGGDMRQVWLAKSLAQKGKRICHYGLCTPLSEPNARPAASLTEAISSSPVLITPIPFSKIINLISFLELSKAIPSEHVVFGGCIPDSFLELISLKKVSVFDFMTFPDFAFWNAKATAEAAIANAILLSPKTLFESNCLILGYGKCAKALSYLLSLSSCKLTVSARNPSQLAQASLIASETLPLNSLSHYDLSSFDFIFNTIPAPILDSTHLNQISPSALLLDLASAPGGFELEKAKALGRNAYVLPCLPGKYSPLSSAQKMLTFIFEQLKISF